MGKRAGAGRGEAQNLKAMRQRSRMPSIAAVLDVVMDRMVIPETVWNAAKFASVTVRLGM